MKLIIGLNKSIAVAVLATLSASCASIINGDKQVISVQSRPSEANITVFDKTGLAIGGGTTPATMTLKRGDGFFSAAKYIVRLEKDGYTSRDIPVIGKISGWYIGGNIFFSGLIGWLIVDPATGGMWTLDPEEVRAELSSEESAFWRNNSGFTVALKSQIPKEYVNHLQPIIPN